MKRREHEQFGPISVFVALATTSKSFRVSLVAAALMDATFDFRTFVNQCQHSVDAASFAAFLGRRQEIKTV